MKAIDFLLINGYEEKTEPNSGYRSFFKEGVSSIDIDSYEIVFVSDGGDWLHLPVNLYALIGALLHHRQITVNYNWLENNK